MYSNEMKRRARVLRKEMTKEERHLWYDFLRDYSVRFLRQHPIGHYIPDFYCAEAKLAIELDGSQHFETSGLIYDRKRTEELAKSGVAVFRIPNNEIWENFYGVCEAIDLEVKARLR